MGRSSRRRTRGERRGLLVFLSFSFSFSRLFQEIFITFFRCRSNQLYSFAETRGKGEKDNNNTTKKTASCASTFQFCTHDYPVYYISSTLQIRTYASSENEKQEIILVLHLPRTPKKEKRKKRIFIRDCTRSTRSNERMNPGIQKKRLLSRLCARTTRLYTRHAVFRCIRHARLRLYYSR